MQNDAITIVIVWHQVVTLWSRNGKSYMSQPLWSLLLSVYHSTGIPKYFKNKREIRYSLKTDSKKLAV